MGEIRRGLLGAGAAGVEDLDGVEVGLLGHTVCRGADGARYVGAVAVAVRVAVVSIVGQERGTPPELLDIDCQLLITSAGGLLIYMCRAGVTAGNLPSGRCRCRCQ